MGDRRTGSNGLGIAGFVVALVGLVTCGILSPIGLLLSAAAMFRPPRGFAIAGLVLGLLGSMWVLAVIALVVALGLPVAGAAVSAGDVATAIDLVEIRRALRAHHQQSGALPTDLDELPLQEDTLTDSWGARYTYRRSGDGRSYTIASPGRDGQPETPDDIHFTATID